jgi:phage/plasmid-like protein (TIGR03299 family)
MAHDVESMVSVREVPWHGLGTIVAEKLTAKECLVEAGLDWEVDLEPIYCKTGDQIYELIEDRFAVRRNTDGSIFQIVSPQYVTIQNYKSFEFFDTVVDSGEAKFDTAGSLGGGRRIFLTATIPSEIKIGGVDPIDLYLLMANSHDGTLAFTAAITPVRVVCQNTLNLALSHNGPQQWKLKHLDQLEGKVQQARDALGMTFSYAEAFESQMTELIDASMAKSEFEDMLRKLFPHKGRGLYSPEQYSMIGVFESSPTIDDSFRYTKWGALNAVREWDDWGRSLRGSKDGGVTESQVTNTWFGANVTRSNKVLSYLQSA